MGMISAVGLVLHPARDCEGALDAIASWAESRQVRVLGLAGEVERIPAAEAVAARDLAGRANLIVSLGGDGTMLRAMRLSHGSDCPVLGVNLGRLGFLAEIDIPELGGALSAINEHQFTVEPRSGVRATFSGQDIIAFNDVALVRVPGEGGSAAVELTVEGHSFVRYAADAVIVATPTGSTAYSFSAGGPIVSPRAEGLLVTPVAPHSAFNRALFLSSGEKLTLSVLSASATVAVETDGMVTGRLHPGDTVELTLLPAAARVVRLGVTTFYQRAQRKLRLSGSAEVDSDD